MLLQKRMFDLALRLRDDTREELLRAFPGVRCFVRIAPVDSPWLLLSDAPRQVDVHALRRVIEARSLPYGTQNGLLHLDAPIGAYEEALHNRRTVSDGPYHQGYERLQATAELLLRQQAEVADMTKAKPLLREGWRAFAMGETQVLLWADAMRAFLARGLREEKCSGLYACGLLLADWLEQKGVPVPVGCAVKWEE